MPVLRGIQGRCGDGYCGGAAAASGEDSTVMLPCLTVGSAKQGTVEVPTAEVMLRPRVKTAVRR